MNEELKMVMDTITGEIGRLGNRIGGLEDQMDQMDGKIDRLEKKMDERFTVLDHRMETAFTDIDLLKKVVSEHSEKLKRIS